LKRIVYLISPQKIDQDFYKSLRKVLATKKVKFFQLRLKKTSKKNIIRIGKKIKSITDKFKVKLIINDSPLITKKLKASGCHIGQTDTSIDKARKILKNKIIGVTCHSSNKLVDLAIKKEVNYIALGSFYKSKLKPNAKKANIKIIKKIKKKTKIPIVVIGGITNKNYKKLIILGANYIAISSFIWNNPLLRPEIAIKKFK
tara:strand:- start:210 stop:812 length:603 start_codon:yes stop_codon:yes gene_type:complete